MDSYFHYWGPFLGILDGVGHWNLAPCEAVIFRTKPMLLGQPRAWGQFSSLDTLNRAVGDAHFLASAAFIQPFCRVLLCLAWWDGPALELPQPMGELDSHSIIYHCALFRHEVQMQLPARSAWHGNAAQLVVTANNSALPVPATMLRFGVTYLTSSQKSPFHGERNWSSGSLSDFLNLPESGRMWIQT